MSAVEIGEKNFEVEVLNSNLPVLVDFWAPWCAPCRMIAPLMEEISQEFAGKIKVGKINADQEFELATRYGILGIPTLLLFKKGEVIEQIVGLINREQLIDMLNHHLEESK
jgi:thioredoxin 1